MSILIFTQPWATLVAIGAKRIETRSWSTTYRAFGDYTPGRYGWLLDDQRRIGPPLPYRGGLGLRTVPRATAIDVMQRAA